MLHRPPVGAPPARLRTPSTRLLIAGLLALSAVSALGAGCSSESAPETAAPPGNSPFRPAPVAPFVCTPLDQLAVHWDRVSGLPARVRATDLRHVAESCSGYVPPSTSGLDAADTAQRVMDNLATLYQRSPGPGDLAVTRVDTDAFGYQHVRLRQRHPVGGDEVDVVGTELLVHINHAGQVYEVNGRYRAGLTVAAAATISAAEAEQQALLAAAADGRASAVAEGPAELVVWTLRGAPQLAYQIDVGEGLGYRQRTFVDATSGVVRDRLSLVYHTLPAGDATLVTITGQGLAAENAGMVTVDGIRPVGTEDRYLFDFFRNYVVREIDAMCALDTCLNMTADDWGETDRAGLSAARNLAGTLDYFLGTHGYDGWDGMGGLSQAGVRWSCDQPNAAYAGNGIFAFGEPTGAFGHWGVADMVAHEFTHAVTDETAGLVYQGESGAINESFSDLFGAVFELTTQPDNRAAYPNTAAGQADWLVGEDVLAGALRDMRNPMNANVATPSPSRYMGTNWVNTASPIDFGGVHTNSGVQNFFFFLLSEGGAGNNDGVNFNVDGIGWQNAANVAFRALTTYAMAGNDYVAIRLAWTSAARDFDDNNPGQDWAASVEAAWDAVDVGAPICPRSYQDTDGDGFGDLTNPSDVCPSPAGFVGNSDDCDDSNGDVFPQAPEICDDGVVNACTFDESVCGELTIDFAGGQVLLDWSSDCLLQTSADLQMWADYGGAVSQVGCARSVSMTPNGNQQFFRLRTP